MDQVFFSSLLSNLFFLPIFILALILAWIIPGIIVLGNLFKEKSFLEKLTLATILGMVLWAYQAIIFGYLNLRFLSFVYILIFLIYWLYKTKIKKPKSVQSKTNFSLAKFIKSNYLLLSIFILGIFGQLQQFFISGFLFKDGIKMFTSSSDDAFWHTALINQLSTNFPPFQPGLSGELVRNYHYVSNLIVADLIRVLHLPLMPTQYQYTYTLLALLIGLIAYTLGKSLGLSKRGLILIVFLQYFTSDIIYLVSYFAKKAFVFTVHPLEDGTMFLENPPRAFASIVCLAIVVFLIEFLKKKNTHIGILLTLLAGVVIGLKVHHGFLILSGLGALTLYLLATRQWRLVIYPLLAVAISLLIYLPVNSKAGSPVFVLFDMPKMFIGQEKVGLIRLELARQIYEQHSNWLQVWRIYLMMLVIFLIAEFGIKNIAFIPLKKTIQKLTTPLAIFLYGGITATLILGTFFIQPIAGADIFNFYLSASLFLGVITAVSLDRWLNSKNKLLISILIALILLMTIPRWIYKTTTVTTYFTKTIPIINSQELKAMKFVKTTVDKNAMILVFNLGQWDSMYPYVSAFTDRKMFLSGQVILGRHGIDIKKRQEIVQQLQNTNNKEEFEKTLREQGITHLYFYSEPKSSLKIPSIPGKKIFYNNAITIFEL